MNPQSPPIAKQLAELELPQSGYEDEDETRLTEPTRNKVTTSTEIVSESDPPADMCLNYVEAFHQHPKTQSVAEPDLPRTPDPATSAHAQERDLPGPLSRDDDEDSSPLIQDLDLADYVPCSTRDMTTSGHDNPTLTHSLGASALGSEIPTSQNAKLTGSDWKVTPASPRLSAASQKAEEECAKLTFGSDLPSFLGQNYLLCKLKIVQRGMGNFRLSVELQFLPSHFAIAFFRSHFISAKF